MKEIIVTEISLPSSIGKLKTKVAYATQIKDISWIKVWERNFLFHRFLIKSVEPYSPNENLYILIVEFASSVERFKEIATITGANDDDVLNIFAIYEGP